MAARVGGALVGALVAAVCAATLADGLASWTVLFGFGLAGAVFVVRVLPRPQIFFTAVYAAMFVLSFGAAWVRNPDATLRLYAVLFVLVVAFSLARSLAAHRRGLGQRISVKKGDRPAYRFSLDGLNWGEAAHERVAWGALTSVEPVGLGDRSLGDVSGVCRVIVRGERDGLLDLNEMNYGPAATLYLLRHYLAHPEDRAELGWGWRFDLRARRAARAGLTYPQTQLQDVAR